MTDDDGYGLSALLHREESFYPPCQDYFSVLAVFSSVEADPVTELWRCRLCEWCYEVVDHFGFHRESVAIAMDYLDRVLSRWSTSNPARPITKRQYQLFAVTSLYISLKIHGDAGGDVPRKLRVEAYAELSRNLFTVTTIEAAERHVLATLNWRVNPTSSYRFMCTMLDTVSIPGCFTPATIRPIYDIAEYLVQLAVCKADMSFKFKSSLVAYAAILCAVEAHKLAHQVRILTIRTISDATGYAPRDALVLEACRMLQELCPAMLSNFVGRSSPVSVADMAPQEVCLGGEKRKDTTNPEDLPRKR